MAAQMHDLEVVDEFKEFDRPVSQTRGRKSPFAARLEQVQGDIALHGRWVRLSSYDDVEKATGSLQALRKTYGYGAEAYGWVFTVGDTGDGRATIMAKYHPEHIVEGKADEHRALVESRKRGSREQAIVDLSGEEPVKKGKK